MRVSASKIEQLCTESGTALSEVLRRAGVSANAFYTLARKDAVVPRSLIRIAEFLEVPVSALLDDVEPPAVRIRELLTRTERIVRRNRGADPDNIRHTLLLLEEKPVDRLRRALRRGQPVNLR